MLELTVDRLSMAPQDESSKPSHSRRHPVTSIIEWAHCFTQYIAIVGKVKPDSIPDLLGYQHLILEAHLEYSGDGWEVYDRRFRQIAATWPGVPWAQRDGDLWYMVFSNAQRKPYCQHCFWSTHSSDQCCGTPETSLKWRPGYIQKSLKPKICHEWNYTQCSFPGCQYIHACLACYGNPLKDSNHTLIHCSGSTNYQQGLPAHPLMGPLRQ